MMGDKMPKYYCFDCDREETDPIMLDAERCSLCGEYIESEDDDV